MDLSWHALTSIPDTGQNSLLCWKAKIWLPWLSKKNSAVSERSAYPLQNYIMLISAHLWVREFWPQIYSLRQALDWGLLSKILGPRMQKGQLSRVPWPGNSWMPFTFQPALRTLQQPHKHSHSLQLATHTELTHQYIQYALSTLSSFFVCVCVCV